MFGVAPRPLAAPLRLRFGPFLPGRRLPRSDGEEGIREEAALFPSTSALFQRHRPPTQTDVGLHLRSRLVLFYTDVGVLAEGGWEKAAITFGGAGGGSGDVKRGGATAGEGSRHIFSKRMNTAFA